MGECTTCKYAPYASQDECRCKTCFDYTPQMKPVWKNYEATELKIKRIEMSSKSIPKYKSTTVNLNNDGSYKVEHIFVDDTGKEIIVKYPRVKIDIDTTIHMPTNHPNVFPFCNCEALTVPYSVDDNNKVLFTVEIKDRQGCRYI